jgi:hypothetical protein
VHAILNGRLEAVHIVGTAVTPEYVFAPQGGAPDDEFFGMYDEMFRFNRLTYVTSPWLVGVSAAIAAVTAALDTWSASTLWCGCSQRRRCSHRCHRTTVPR